MRYNASLAILLFWLNLGKILTTISKDDKTIMSNYFAGIEAGGTKFICAVGDGLGNNIERISIKTSSPEETLSEAAEFFQRINQTHRIKAMGIGSFGPIDADLESRTYGHILHTPKKAWINCDIVGYFRDLLNVPIGFETDVNVAAMGEAEYGCGKGLYNFVYMTIGTGIGAAAMVDGKIIRGMCFSEMGHMLIPHDKAADPYPGNCPYHGDCFEGLACGGAIKERWNILSALDLPVDHPAWDLEADYIAAGLMNIILVLAPERIILGGGVMRQQQLFHPIRKKVLNKINSYITTDTLIHDMNNYIVAPGLADHSGVNGAIALARQTFEA